jgi:hypothetical protein
MCAKCAASLKATPGNYVWHHVEDSKTMQLIRREIHGAARHTGGVAVIRNGGFDRPMNIKLKKGKPVSEETCLRLQAALGCPLSRSFMSFLRENDGAEPETNIFKIAHGNESGVNRFIPASQILRERDRIENIPDKAYPVAWAEGGNYVFIDEGRNGGVFFWDHEMPEHIVELAPSFGAFLDVLKPFDISQIQLKPGQVKRAWIDPEFLKSLNQ